MFPDAPTSNSLPESPEKRNKKRTAEPANVDASKKTKAPPLVDYSIMSGDSILDSSAGSGLH